MQDVLEGSARLTINMAGRLVVFDGSPITRTADLDGDHRQDTAVVSQDDARSLLTGATPVTSAADSAVAQLDFSFPDCGALAQSAPPPTPTPVARRRQVLHPRHPLQCRLPCRHQVPQRRHRQCRYHPCLKIRLRHAYPLRRINLPRRRTAAITTTGHWRAGCDYFPRASRNSPACPRRVRGLHW